MPSSWNRSRKCKGICISRYFSGSGRLVSSKKDDKFHLFQDKEQYKNLYKHYFEGCLDVSGNFEPPKVKIVEEFFYDVFTNYNVQMWGMLASEKLVDSTENAMNEMATDIVHRLVFNSNHCLTTDCLVN